MSSECWKILGLGFLETVKMFKKSKDRMFRDFFVQDLGVPVSCESEPTIPVRDEREASYTQPVPTPGLFLHLPPADLYSFTYQVSRSDVIGHVMT